MQKSASMPGSSISEAFVAREKAELDKLLDEHKGKSEPSEAVRRAKDRLRLLKEVPNPSEAILRSIEAAKKDLQQLADSDVRSPMDQLRSAESKLTHRKQKLEKTKAANVALRKQLADMAKQLEEGEAAEAQEVDDVRAAEVELAGKQQAIAVSTSATVVQADTMDRMQTVLVGMQETISKKDFFQAASPQHIKTMFDSIVATFKEMQKPHLQQLQEGPSHFNIADEGSGTVLGRPPPAIAREVGNGTEAAATAAAAAAATFPPAPAFDEFSVADAHL